MAMAVSSIGNHLFNTVQLTAVSALTVASLLMLLINKE